MFKIGDTVFQVEYGRREKWVVCPDCLGSKHVKMILGDGTEVITERTKMTVLAFLQNMWVRDPERVKASIARMPQVRRRMIHYSLFAGCRTGQVLKSVFGEERCREIVWEESTTEIAGNPRDVFPPDVAHIQAVLAEVRPQVVLAFGRIASAALAPLVPPEKLIIGPHPTARQGDTMRRLRTMAARLDALIDIGSS